MAPIQPEPILDVVRGLSTVASFAIVLNQLKSMYETFFISCCARCRGTGLLTCPHCHGTKTLRRRPGYLRTRDLTIVDSPRDSYLCFHCGPPTVYDHNPFAPDDEQTAMKIQENLKMAVANIWPKPFDTGALAGTVPCGACGGAPRVRRLTPDFGKAFGLGEAWDFSVAKRMGRMFLTKQGRPADAARLFLEFPASPPASPVELPAERPAKEVAAAKEGDSASGSFTLSSSAAFNLEDYVLPYVDDE